MTIGPILLIILSLLLAVVLIGRQTVIFNQSGGSRAAIFSRFNYEPLPPNSWPFISKFTQNEPNKYAHHYNNIGPLKMIMNRPYHNYTGDDGSWLYPWHFPETAQTDCYALASNRCNEPINWKDETIHPSQCFDSVYKQCRQGVDPLLIKVDNQGVYDYFN